MTRHTRVFMLLVLAACSLHAENAFVVKNTEAAAGQDNVLVEILANNDAPVAALSFVATYDAHLTFDRLTLEGTEMGPGGLAAEYLEPFSGEQYFGAGIIIDFGPPRAIRLGVLVERDGREYPIQPDYSALRVKTQPEEVVKVWLRQVDGDEKVVLAPRPSDRPTPPPAP